VKANQATYPVRVMCRLLAVSVSGFYAWRDRPPSRRALRDIALTAKIHVIHRQARECYGAPRIHAELSDEHGIHVGRKRVARLMRAAGLRGVSRRRFVRTTVPDCYAHLPPDLVDRNFRISELDRLWVADITYVPTWAGFLYLAIVLDACSRRVVGWAMENHLKTELVLAAINMALAQRRPEGVIHHSDHGCQYTSFAFGKRCREMGVVPSVGSVGDAYDNAMAESFFATLECELLDRRSFRTQAEAKLAVFEYLEGFYNPRRRHSSLGYRSPVAFERGLIGQQPTPHMHRRNIGEAKLWT
jgi:putative transposase